MSHQCSEAVAAVCQRTQHDLRLREEIGQRSPDGVAEGYGVNATLELIGGDEDPHEWCDR